MDLSRGYIWLWVIIGMIFVTLVISLIFILINKCISKEAESRTLQPHKDTGFYAQSNKYHPKDLEQDLPPLPRLPPRTQFLTTEAQSYENLTEQADYVKVEDEVILPPPPSPSPPPYQQPDTAESCYPDNISTEDYDDIGEDADCQDGEDYDDVG